MCITATHILFYKKQSSHSNYPVFGLCISTLIPALFFLLFCFHSFFLFFSKAFLLIAKLTRNLSLVTPPFSFSSERLVLFYIIIYKKSIFTLVKLFLILLHLLQCSLLLLFLVLVCSKSISYTY